MRAVWRLREPVWLSGKALRDLNAAVGPRFESASALFSLQKLLAVDTLIVTLSFTMNETFKWLAVTVYLVLGIVSLFPHLLGSQSPPLPVWRQFRVKHV